MHDKLKKDIENLIAKYNQHKLDGISHNSIQVLRGLLLCICMNETSTLAKQTLDLASKIMEDAKASLN